VKKGKERGRGRERKRKGTWKRTGTEIDERKRTERSF
jgi:hypothetical protein